MIPAGEPVPTSKPSRRGTSSKDVQGSAATRRRRKRWLVETYRADRDLVVVRYDHDYRPPLDGALVVLDDVGPERRPSAVANFGGDDADAWASWLMMRPDVAEAFVVPACRCYRCGVLVHALIEFEDGSTIKATVSPDRIVPGCVKTPRYPKGGTYARENIRPCCEPCNMSTGGALGNARLRARASGRRP